LPIADLVIGDWRFGDLRLAIWAGWEKSLPAFFI
jgi:hypothetical protein